MSEQIYLGVDLGAESGRVMAGIWDGKILRLEELHRFPNGGVAIADTLRWDVLRLWNEIQHGLALAARRFGKSVVSVGVDTWGVDYVLLSKTGELLGQPYHYRDTRTKGMFQEAFAKVSKPEIFAATGLQFMEINTLYQLLAHQQRNPEILTTAHRFLMMPDFFNWCLSGEQAVEFTNATTTQFFHPTNRTWSMDLLQGLGLPAHILPQVVEPGTRLGALRKSLMERTGLGAAAVIAPATHDTGSAVAAVPTSIPGRSNWAYISSGTWSLMGVEVKEAVTSPRALELNFTNEGGIDGTYRLLKNIMGLWLVQQCKRAFEAKDRSADYPELVKLAEAAEPLRSFINPDDSCFLNPPDMASAIQRFCRETGQPVPETEGQIIRCVLESLALKYKSVLAGLEELTGTPIEVIHVVGGGCRNMLLNQFTANACGRPVLAGPVEATVMGNLLVQIRSKGELGSDLRSVVRASSEVTEVKPQSSAQWDDAFGRFCQLSQP
ncbi:MAG: rhaB [Verrucomicrobiales bacterium]|nr:rhaB [Verrucomicrobiales bacterium]